MVHDGELVQLTIIILENLRTMRTGSQQQHLGFFCLKSCHVYSGHQNGRHLRNLDVTEVIYDYETP